MTETVQRRPHTRVPKPGRATRPAGPPNRDTTSCCCRRYTAGKLHDDDGGPLMIATFRDGELVAVERLHWRGRDGCLRPNEHLTAAEWSSK